MATTEHVGVITYKDGEGNLFVMYPRTQADAVDGLTEMLEQVTDMDFGRFEDETYTLEAHEVYPRAHRSLRVDGNVTVMNALSENRENQSIEEAVAEHNMDIEAHPNLIVDGSEEM